MTPETHRIRRALISVSDKSGIVEFARQLHTLGIEIVSTGGTASTLAAEGIPVTSVSDITDFPEVMDGRVKTLHPKIHGGLLALLDDESHVAQMREHGIESIDLAVINLYPFEAALKRNESDEDIIENIDIGGPAMVRASAKNFRWTGIVVNPASYQVVLDELSSNECTLSLPLRRRLAAEAFAHTAYYDSMISGWMMDSVGVQPDDRQQLAIGFPRAQQLRYGENPHQRAALFGNFSGVFTQLHGKELSYNNIVDIDAAARLVLEFESPAVAIIKHTNPCGVAVGETLEQAWHRAFSSDTQSPFGGIIAVNKELDMEAAQALDGIFTEVVIAPSFAPGVLELLEKKKQRRLMAVDLKALRHSLRWELKTVAGGLLVQSADDKLLADEGLKVVTKRQPSAEEMQAMMFAWKVAKHVKSNAIIYANSSQALAIGAGQMSRVDSAGIAVRKAESVGLQLAGSAVASDAFFPFADGLLTCVQAGATAVIQPGGSVRDQEVIDAADANGIAMVFTGMRHFKH